MRQNHLGIKLDKLTVLVENGNYLVVNSRPNIDSWRYSHESAARLKSDKQSIKFLDLSFLDPSASMLFTLRKLIRTLIRHKNFERLICKDMKSRGIEIIRISWLQQIFYFLDFSGLLEISRNIPVIPKENEVAINSWLSITSGSTHFKWGIKSRINLFLVKRTIRWTNRIFERHVSKSYFSTILTFNGRFPVDGTILLKAKSIDIETILFDGGSLSGDNRNRIQYFNTSPHNPNESLQKIEEYWDEGDERDRQEISKAYLSDISKGKRGLRTSFEWNPHNSKTSIDSSKSVVFFASSDWEQGAIMKWLPLNGFRNQFEVVDALVDICSNLGLNLIIKTHPIRKNYKGKKSLAAEKAVWEKYNGLNQVQIISNELSVSSSDLISRALINVGFRTSVSAQSLYAGKPTAVCAQVPWITIDSEYVYTPNQELLKEAIQRRLNGRVLSVNLLPIFKWAYYQAVCGSNMRFSEISAGEFRIHH